MHRFHAILAAGLLFTAAAFAQSPYIGPGVKATEFLQYSSAPSGACVGNSVGFYGGNYYGCVGGTWEQFSSAASGSGVSTAGLTTGVIPKATGSATIGDSKLDDGLTTANTLTYTGAGGIQSQMIGVGMTSGAVPTANLEAVGVTDMPSDIVPSGIFKVQSPNTSMVIGVYADGTYNGTYFQAVNTPVTSGGVYRLSFNPLGGNVGIGTLDPTSTLSVAGNGDFAGNLIAATFTAKPGTYVSLAACASGTEGTTTAVTDSTTNTWGATISGGGTDHVLAYCDGTNWTVAAK